MKRAFILLVISLSLGSRGAVAQDAAAAPNTAAAIAAREGDDERYKRMAADIQALQTDNESLKARIAALEQKIDGLSQQQTAANNSGVQDDLKRLSDKIVQVDQKREQDKLAISEEIRKTIGGLEKTLAGSGAPARQAALRAPADTAGSTAGANDLAYTIKDGDNLSVVVHAYNVDFKSKGWKTISLRQAMAANPNVDWARLRVGQKIIIPNPQGL